MTEAFKLQDPGEGVHEVEIQEILVAEGDHVDEGQNVFVVESDKAAIEVPVPFTGTVAEIKVSEGDIAEVGDVLMTVETGERQQDEGKKKALPEEEDEDAEEEPAEADDAEASGSRKREADSSDEEAGESRAGSEEKGKGRDEEPEKEGNKRDGDPEKDRRSRHEKPDDKDESKAKHKADGEADVSASPAARNKAKELGIDLSAIEGSGSKGHVTRKDVEAFANEGKPARRKTDGQEKKDGKRRERGADQDDFGPIERQPLRSLRRATARRMAKSWAEIPHVTHQDKVDITELEQARQALIASLGENGPKLTLTAFVLKALGVAVKRHPRFNASLDSEAEEIVLKKYCNIALALDSDRGLLAPVIRDIDGKSVLELAEEAEALGERLRGGKAEKKDMEGGTFTVTNVGGLGGTAFNPIINHPQVAILGMARARLEQVVEGDLQNQEVRVRYMLPLMLAFDHRVIDGADAARFMADLIELLKNPARLLVELR